MNASPLLMPPTWIVLSSFFALDPSLEPLLLSLVGATGATIGRFFLKHLSSFFRRFIGKERKTNVTLIGNFLNQKKYGYFLASFLFASTPLPSNMLFVAYGIMNAKNVGLYVGFWLGRVISYYIMISVSNIVLTPFLQFFEERYLGILLADGVGIAVVVFFMSIDWELLFTKRKFRLVRPRIWRL